MYPSSDNASRYYGHEPMIGQQSIPQTARSAYLFISFLTYLLLGQVLPWLCVYELWEIGKFGSTVLAYWGFTQVCALRLAWLAGQARPRLMTIFFYLAVYILVCIPSLSQLFVNRFPWKRVHSADTEWAGLAALCVTVGAYELGCRWQRSLSGAAPWQGSGTRLQLSYKRLMWWSGFAAVTTFVGVIFFGGLDQVIATRGTFGVGAWGKTKLSVLLMGATMRAAAYVPLLCVVYVCVRRWRTLTRQHRRAFAFLLLWLLALNFVANYPPAQTRFWGGTMALSLILVVLRFRQAQVPALISGLAVLVLVVYPYADLFRSARNFDEAIGAFQRQPPITRLLISKGDYDMLQMTFNGVEYVEQRGISYGRNLMGALLFWVPRRFWATKPYGTGQEVVRHFGYRFTNVSAPLWLEAYCAGGWLGLALILVAYGRFSGWLDASFERHLYRPDDAVLRLLVVFLAPYQFFLLRGDLQNALAIASPVLIVLVCLAHRRKARQAAQRSPLALVGQTVP